MVRSCFGFVCLCVHLFVSVSLQASSAPLELSYLEYLISLSVYLCQHLWGPFAPVFTLCMPPFPLCPAAVAWWTLLIVLFIMLDSNEEVQTYVLLYDSCACVC